MVKRNAVGIGLALGLFLAAFALHIVGGASDQRWLFLTAVVLIFFSAAAFPVVALVASRRPRAAKQFHYVTFAIGTALTWSALWAAADRSFAAWQPFVAIAAVAILSLPFLGFLAKWFHKPASVARPKGPGRRVAARR